MDTLCYLSKFSIGDINFDGKCLLDTGSGKVVLSYGVDGYPDGYPLVSCNNPQGFEASSPLNSFEINYGGGGDLPHSVSGFTGSQTLKFPTCAAERVLVNPGVTQFGPDGRAGYLPCVLGLTGQSLVVTSASFETPCGIPPNRNCTQFPFAFYQGPDVRVLSLDLPAQNFSTAQPNSTAFINLDNKFGAYSAPGTMSVWPRDAFERTFPPRELAAQYNVVRRRINAIPAEQPLLFEDSKWFLDLKISLKTNENSTAAVDTGFYGYQIDSGTPGETLACWRWGETRPL